MEHDWTSVALQDLIEPESPITYGVVKPGDEDSNGVLFIRGGDIADGRILTEQLRTITREVSKQYKRTLLRGGEILVSLVGNPGQAAIVPSELQGANIARQVGLIRLRQNVNTEYVKYFLRSPMGQEALGARSLGSVQQVINLSDLKTVRIPLPPLPEQRAIAHILGSLDDKIELNRRMNATLEATARAIFKSWFVDFDPVHAKARGELPPGTDAATAALFPDSFEQSELGMIPAGWGVEPLDEIANFQNGLALQNYPPEGDEYLPVVKIRELRQGYVDEKSDKASRHIREECILSDGDVVFSWSGSLLLEIWCGGTAALNQHLFKVTSESYPKWFYYYWTLHYLEEFQRIAAGKATTMGHIQRHHLSAVLTAIPPTTLLQQADEIISPYFATFIGNRLQSRTLAQLRDTLLPKLISGEVRVGG
ncbi:MAG: restriction endonuclease subunit S [Chloroflexota bacterium]